MYTSSLEKFLFELLSSFYLLFCVSGVGFKSRALSNLNYALKLYSHTLHPLLMELVVVFVCMGLNFLHDYLLTAIVGCFLTPYFIRNVFPFIFFFLLSFSVYWR